MSNEVTILYIEDDAISRQLIERVLTKAGYRVVVAARALEGIDLARKGRPDLILTDINLPDLSGREIAVRLRGEPLLADVPIVALTAQTLPTDRDKAFVAGLVGYITKPVDIATLPQQIAGYLKGTRDDVDRSRLDAAQQAYSTELVNKLERSVRDLEAANSDLRRLDRIKDDFIQLTAHELRTPLTTVYGYSRLVQTSPSFREAAARDAEASAALDGLVTSIERLQLVIDELITVSRIALGRVDLKLGPTNLREVIEGVLHDYARIAEQRKLKIVTDLDEWPRSMIADSALLSLAFSNLLGNAIKYTPDGGTITLGVKPDPAKLHITIRDNGVGINPQEHDQIFERFYTAGDTQLHSTSKTAFRGGGLGLGLAICRGIVEAHGGRLWVESKGYDPQNLPGSTFHVEIARQPGPQTAVRGALR